MVPQNRDPLWSKGIGGQRADASMARRIEKQHLLHHHSRDGSQIFKPHRRQPIRGRCPLCREIMENPKDRKSTRLNSSHRTISYAVFCLKKKTKKKRKNQQKSNDR